MLKNIKNLDGVTLLSKKEQKNLNGGLITWCKRRSQNVIDLRDGASSTPDSGFLNSNGCWVYAGMSWNASPNCPPGSPAWCM